MWVQDTEPEKMAVDFSIANCQYERKWPVRIRSGPGLLFRTWTGKPQKAIFTQMPHNPICFLKWSFWKWECVVVGGSRGSGAGLLQSFRERERERWCWPGQTWQQLASEKYRKEWSLAVSETEWKSPLENSNLVTRRELVGTGVVENRQWQDYTNNSKAGLIFLQNVFSLTRDLDPWHAMQISVPEYNL